MIRIRLTPFIVVLALALPGAALDATGAPAAKLKPADIVWIDTCVVDRKRDGGTVSVLRKYCACMQAIVEDNQPFGVTELERSYPPAHLMCRKQAGQK